MKFMVHVASLALVCFFGPRFLPPFGTTGPDPPCPAPFQVWASKWNERAFFSCRKARINHDDLSMAVLCQQVIRADYAYVIHTTNPSSGDENEIYAEVVRGLGETLVGAYSGRALSFAAKKGDLQPKVSYLQPSACRVAPFDISHRLILYQGGLPVAKEFRLPSLRFSGQQATCFQDRTVKSIGAAKRQSVGSASGPRLTTEVAACHAEELRVRIPQ